MGLEDYLLASVLRGVIAQRLVRCLCAACREPYAPPPQIAALARGSGDALPRQSGCAACDGTGYRGRTAIAELLVLDARLCPADPRARRPAGASSPRRAPAAWSICAATGCTRPLAGITSLEEVLRVTGDA